MAAHSNILAWRIPQTEKPGRLQSMGSQSVGHVCMTNTFFFKLLNKENYYLLNNNDVFILERNLLSAFQFQRYVKQPRGLDEFTVQCGRQITTAEYREKREELPWVTGHRNTLGEYRARSFLRGSQKQCFSFTTKYK